MPPIEDTRFETLLHAEIPRENVSREAWALRVVQRVRKIDVYTLLVTVVLEVRTLACRERFQIGKLLE